MKKVVIIGAGPAGLFAAKELVEHGYNITVYDKGKDVEYRSCSSKNKKPCSKCNPCNILCGVGGAGTFSDGKLNFHHRIGGNLLEFVETEKEAYMLIDEIEKTFLNYGAPASEDYDREKAGKLLRDALIHGIEFIPIKQTHIGSDNLVNLIKSFRDDLKSKGVEFVTETEIIDFERKNNKFYCIASKGDLSTVCESDYIIFTPGRSGEEEFIKIGEKHNLGLAYRAVDIGVRVETRKELMDPITSINYDPKLIVSRKARTFCTNPGGFVVKEQHKGYCLVNGHANRNGEKSNNTNFALLYRLTLGRSIDSNPFKHITWIAQGFNEAGGDKPILQSLEKFLEYHTSTEQDIESCLVKPTLTDVTIANISTTMPCKIQIKLTEALRTLSNIIPGLMHGKNTLIYAPEIKFNSMRPEIIENLESKTIENLYFAGDGAGLTRGIVQAAVTGLIAANGIIKKWK